jgi:NADPH:quinone reductase-like Zn-dependent oxidoreductase
MGHLFDELEMLGEQFASLVALYEAGRVKPRVDRAFSFSEAPLAHHYLHDRLAKGKVVLTP